MKHRCVAASPGAFVRQIVASYLPHGYHYYVAGHVPDRDVNQPERVDRVLAAKYGVCVSKSVRSGLRRGGNASIRYLRHERFWLLISTDGKRGLGQHHTYVHHFGRRPLTFHGYAIRLIDSKPMVYVDRVEYRHIKQTLMSICSRDRYRDQRYMAATIRNLFLFEPYMGVLEQFVRLMRQINKKRSGCGFQKIPLSMVTLRSPSLGKPRLRESEPLNSSTHSRPTLVYNSSRC